MPETTVCCLCVAPFEVSKGYKGIYCSPACGEKDRVYRAEAAEKGKDWDTINKTTCSYCGGTYTWFTKGARLIHCSTECYEAAGRKEQLVRMAQQGTAPPDDFSMPELSTLSALWENETVPDEPPKPEPQLEEGPKPEPKTVLQSILDDE